MQWLRSFHTAERMIEGIETALMMRKGQVKRLDGEPQGGRRSSSQARSMRLHRRRVLHNLPCIKSIFATQPSRGIQHEIRKAVSGCGLGRRHVTPSTDTAQP